MRKVLLGPSVTGSQVATHKFNTFPVILPDYKGSSPQEYPTSRLFLALGCPRSAIPVFHAANE